MVADGKLAPDKKRNSSGHGRPLRRALPQLALAGSGAFQPRARLLRPLGRGALALRAVLGRRVGGERRPFVLGNPAASQTPLELPGAPRVPARQRRGRNPPAPPENGSPLHGDLRIGGGWGAAFPLFRAGTARP